MRNSIDWHDADAFKIKMQRIRTNSNKWLIFVLCVWMWMWMESNNIEKVSANDFYCYIYIYDQNKTKRNICTFKYNEKNENNNNKIGERKKWNRNKSLPRNRFIRIYQWPTAMIYVILLRSFWFDQSDGDNVNTKTMWKREEDEKENKFYKCMITMINICVKFCCFTIIIMSYNATTDVNKWPNLRNGEKTAVILMWYYNLIISLSK